ncbi:hypothetical protein [Flaviflagellibacter deserti]|uniref:Uncharacterized protein n=1 Tax=Flaviflagellibacter deserti TaxID=2267266 RepID=A0ABV9Z7F6_9HYPH
MTKYLITAAFAGLVGVAAFTGPAAAQVSFGIGVGPDYRDRYYDDRYYGDRYYRRGPGVTVYSGRSAYRDDCRTRRTTRWVDGRRVTRTVRVCD